MATDFQLPNLGENVAGGDVLRIIVNPGDTLTKDQPVLELETDKATIEVPSSVAGVVTEVKVKVGDKVKVGQVILTVDEGAAGAAAPAPAAAAAAPTPAPAQPASTTQLAAAEEPGMVQHAEGQKAAPANDRQE
ncbi:MAG: biotin/lipoyl-binding protein [Vicinamibacterales bacterium]